MKEVPLIHTDEEEQPPWTEDESGFIVIFLKDGFIYVEHYDRVIQDGQTVTGDLTHVFMGRDPMKLYKSVISRGLISRLDHGAYIGKELERASTCLRDSEEYVQDGC